MSNRERIERLRAEADATAREKAEAKEKKATAAPRKKSASAAAAEKPVSRVRFVWSLRGPTGSEVKRFPYAQEAEARAEAEQLTASTGRTHFVTKAEEPR